MVNSKRLDYQWSLIYVGKLKVYQLTESKLIDGEWIQVASSAWETLSSALDHIELANERRLREG